VISVKVAGRHLTVVGNTEPVADHVRWLGYVCEQMSVNLDLIALSTSVSSWVDAHNCGYDGESAAD